MLVEQRGCHPLFRKAKMVCYMAMLFAAGCGAGLAHAVEPAVEYNLLELPSSQLALARLQTEGRFFWEKRPLREGLGEIEKVHEITIWIDRRIDPDQAVTLEALPANKSQTLQSRLAQVASLINAEAGLIENVVYFGPRRQVARLQRATVELHDAISKSTSGNRATLREFSWPELATPNELLHQLQATWKIRLSAELPHDLFHAGNFSQPSTLATQLSVVCGGFDQEVVWQPNNTFRLRPLGAETRWRANYRNLDVQGASSLTNSFPGSRVQTRGSSSLVAGVTDFHLAILAPAPAKPPPPSSNSQRWGFNVENAPVEDVLNKLGSSMGFEISWAEDCPSEQRRQLISFRVNDATLDELLSEVSKVSSLTIVRNGQRVSVRPLEK